MYTCVLAFLDIIQGSSFLDNIKLPDPTMLRNPASQFEASRRKAIDPWQYDAPKSRWSHNKSIQCSAPPSTYPTPYFKLTAPEYSLLMSGSASCNIFTLSLWTCEFEESVSLRWCDASEPLSIAHGAVYLFSSSLFVVLMAPSSIIIVGGVEKSEEVWQILKWRIKWPGTWIIEWLFCWMVRCHTLFLFSFHSLLNWKICLWTGSNITF